VTARCKEKKSVTAVEIICNTSNCKLSSSVSADHMADIRNMRPSSIYETEVSSAVLGTLIEFVGPGKAKAKKVITTIGIVSSAGCPVLPARVQMAHLGTRGTEEILSTVEFFDATQRTGPHTYSGTKKSYNVNYELDVI
jgi:hypothetical protein